jgi:hypothetical protein
MLDPKQGQRDGGGGLAAVFLRVRAQVVVLGCGVRSLAQAGGLDPGLREDNYRFIAEFQS